MAVDLQPSAERAGKHASARKPPRLQKPLQYQVIALNYAVIIPVKMPTDTRHTPSGPAGGAGEELCLS